VELVGATDLGRGQGRQTERGRDRSRREHAARAGGEGIGELTRCEWGRRERGQGPSHDQSDRAGDAGGTD
jgi:hypothetical protein